jgi:alcohol dehydrogenase class IV
MGDRYGGVYTGVRSHSPVPVVQEAARELKRLDADAVIALGGGSAIVTARAANILLAEQGDVRSLCTKPHGSGRLKSPKLLAPKLPHLVIPTTPTTASVKAGAAILDPVTGERLALFDPATRAQATFIQSNLIETPSRELFVSAAQNTFALAVDRHHRVFTDPQGVESQFFGFLRHDGRVDRLLCWGHEDANFHRGVLSQLGS